MKISESLKRWGLAVGYVLFIYATLNLVGVPLTYLRDHGLLEFFLGLLYFFVVLGLVYFLAKRKAFQIWRMVFLAVIFLAYFLLSQNLSSPEEQIHFLQYGLVGVLFFQALQTRFPMKWKAFLGALILASLAGWLDEILQGISPKRHYDIRDIWLNIVSSFLGLIIFSMIPPKPTKNLS